MITGRAGVPRAYRLPYDAKLAEKTEKAIAASAEGEPQGGRSADYGTGEGGISEEAIRLVTPSTITTTGGGDPSTGSAVDPLSGTAKTKASALRTIAAAADAEEGPALGRALVIPGASSAQNRRRQFCRRASEPGIQNSARC